MQFALVQLSHLAGFRRELTRISIGGAIPHSMGWMGLVAAVEVCTLFALTEGPHPQHSANITIIAPGGL